jgi:hypothetical protein
MFKILGYSKMLKFNINVNGKCLILTMLSLHVKVYGYF